MYQWPLCHKQKGSLKQEYSRYKNDNLKMIIFNLSNVERVEVARQNTQSYKNHGVSIDLSLSLFFIVVDFVIYWNPIGCSMPGFPVLRHLLELAHACPLSQGWEPIILSSVTPFSSCFQSFPASGSFPMSWLFASGGQIIGASASVSVLEQLKSRDITLPTRSI